MIIILTQPRLLANIQIYDIIVFCGWMLFFHAHILIAL